MSSHQRPPRPVVVFFGNDWSGENRTSSHHIAVELSKRYEVHYIECPGLRAPTGSRRDVRKLLAKVVKSVARPKRVSQSQRVYTLLQVPFHRFRLIRRLNEWLLRKRVRRILSSTGIRNFIAWFTVPHVATLARSLGETTTVYYCIDDYAALPGVDVDAIAAMDEELTRRADIVFVASPSMLDSKRALNCQTFLSPHGVDAEHFRAAQSAGNVPADVANLSHPLIGFFGLIEAWIDLDLVEYLARNRPAWNFVMVGRVAVSHPGVESCPNVHFLGSRPYDSLPAYGREFDAAIIPYHLTKQVLHANPLKLREYLAMGKPVVSVRTPEIERFADVVRIADSREEFLQHLTSVLASRDSHEDIRRRLERVAQSSWQACVEKALKRIDEIRLPAQCASMPARHRALTTAIND